MPELKRIEGYAATFDDRRCIVCGSEWSAHSPDCSRHAYRPGASPQLDLDDPKLVDATIAWLNQQADRSQAVREDLRLATPEPTGEVAALRAEIDRLRAELAPKPPPEPDRPDIRRVFEHRLADLLANNYAGWWAAVDGHIVRAVRKTREQAWDAGFNKCGIGNFQVFLVEAEREGVARADDAD